MNDLNSVFLVGKIISWKIDEKKEELHFTLNNSHNTFNEEKKEYNTEGNIFPVVMFGHQAEKMEKHFKKGGRIGVNGRIRIIDEKFSIVAYTIQFLDTKVGS